MTAVVVARGQRPTDTALIIGAVVLLLVGGGQDLGPVTSRVSRWLLIDINTTIAFHDQTLALLAACLNDTRGATAVAVTSD